MNIYKQVCMYTSILKIMTEKLMENLLLIKI